MRLCLHAAAAEDDRDLARAGYVPQFRRGLGSFAAFAAGFSYLSILTGIVQNFHLGFREAGPAFFWTWPAVFAGQFCVALCFAELAHRYPFCGGIYAWAGRAGSPAVGWLIGWVYLASLVVTLAAVALAWQITLPALWPGFQILDTPARNAALLGVALITLSTFFNVLGTRWLTLLMTVGVVAELVAAVALIALLGGHAVRGSGVVFEVRIERTDGRFRPRRAVPRRGGNGGLRDVRLRHGGNTVRGDHRSAASGPAGHPSGSARRRPCSAHSSWSPPWRVPPNSPTRSCPTGRAACRT